MAGIYFHIPFCRKICGYCDFFKNTSLKQKDALLDAMVQELKLRKNYVHEPITTIYLGGGTPSVLRPSEIARLLESVYQHFTLTPQAEITLEANPDDITLSYLKALKRVGINRLSIGIQSFDDETLQFMNRRHTAQEAIDSVHAAKNAAFENISLDIIYGIPNTDITYLYNNLTQLCELAPSHISAYHLTIEQGTPFAHLKKKGKLQEIPDEKSETQYAFLVQFLHEKKYKQYEISNFCQNGKIAEHNTNYWMQKPYLGIGPSAHSYDGNSRQWNLSNLKSYIVPLGRQQLPAHQTEVLSNKDQYNDYILVRLRTKWGIDLKYIEKNFGVSYIQNTKRILEVHKEDFHIHNSSIFLKSEAFLRSDYLIAKFFVI